MDFLSVSFPFHFVAGFQFFLSQYTGIFEHADTFRLQIAVEDERHTGFAIQTAFLGLFFPFVTVAVAIEMDGLTNLDVFADNLKDSRNLRFTPFDEFVHIFFEFYQLLGYGGVQGNHGTGTVCFRTYGAELKTVSGEGERTGAVTVGIVNQQFRNLRNIQFHALLAAKAYEIILCTLFNVFQYLRQLFAQEAGNDCGRCFVGTQAVCVRGTGNSGFQQSIVLVDCHQGIHYESDEAQVFFG